MDVRDNSTTGDGCLDQRVQLLVAYNYKYSTFNWLDLHLDRLTFDSQQDLSWLDRLDLHVATCIAGQLKNLRGEILQDPSHVQGTQTSHLDAAVLHVPLHLFVDSECGKLKKIRNYISTVLMDT